MENSLWHCFLPALVSYTPKGQQDGVLLRTTWKVGGNEVVEIKSGGNRSDPILGCVPRHDDQSSAIPSVMIPVSLQVGHLPLPPQFGHLSWSELRATFRPVPKHCWQSPLPPQSRQRLLPPRLLNGMNTPGNDSTPMWAGRVRLLLDGDVARGSHCFELG